MNFYFNQPHPVFFFPLEVSALWNLKCIVRYYKDDSETEFIAATQKCSLGKEMQIQCIASILDLFKLSALTLTKDACNLFSLLSMVTMNWLIQFKTGIALHFIHLETGKICLCM